MIIPSIGRICHYTLDQQDANEVNRRRDDARRNLDWHREHQTGAVVHAGNSVSEGDVFPLIITKVWSAPANENSSVNGQVLLDGDDTLWVTSVQQGDGLRHWLYLPKVNV